MTPAPQVGPLANSMAGDGGEDQEVGGGSNSIGRRDMSTIICPNCRMRVLPKSDGTCPSCHSILEKAHHRTAVTPSETAKGSATKISTGDRLERREERSNIRGNLRFLVWFIILLAIIVLSLFGKGILRTFDSRFDFVALLGLALGLGGVVTIVRSFQAGRWRQARSIISGIVFVFIGAAQTSSGTHLNWTPEVPKPLT